jgi:hypothetical protein
MGNKLVDIRRMIALARPSFPLAIDFGNASSATQGLPCPKAGDIGAPGAENADLVGIKTHLSLGFPVIPIRSRRQRSR